MSPKSQFSPRDALRTAIFSLVDKSQFPWTNAEELAIPHHWEQFDDLILLPENAFLTPTFTALSSEVWPIVAHVFHVSRVARHGRIQSDDFRSPRLELLLGSDTWVRKRENGLIYELNLAKSMFSSGNVTEKQRMLSLNCRDEIVVDLFAGIGYFTIPVLKAGARLVYACEWNLDAVEALQRNLKLNGFSDRCIILPGNNRAVAPTGVADRVLLGLIPSSEVSWKVACGCLNRDRGGILHVHANVDLPKNVDHVMQVATGMDSDLTVLSKAEKRKHHIKEVGLSVLHSLLNICHADSQEWTGQLLHCECVKSYGPNVFHCVFDIELRPYGKQATSG